MKAFVLGLGLLPTGCPHPASFIRGRTSALPSNTQGRSRMPELGTYGSERGVPGNGHPYRDYRSHSAATVLERKMLPKPFCRGTTWHQL
jgi:hypothetical protein